MHPNKTLSIAFLIFLFSGILNAQDWKQHNQNMIKNFQAGDLKTAIAEGEKAAGLIKGDSALIYEYAGIINNLSFLYLSDKEYSKSIEGYNEVLDILLPAVGKEHKYYLKSLCFLGEAYMYSQQFDKAESIFHEALNTRKKTLDKKELMYLYSYVLLRRLYVEMQVYDKALLYQDTVLQLTMDAYGQYHPNHLIELSNKADIYERKTNFNEALKLRELILNKYQEIDELNDNSLGALHLLGDIYRKKGDYNNAVATFEMLAQKKKKRYGKSIEYAMALSTTGVIYFEMGNYDKATAFYEDAFELLKSLGAENTADYGMVLNNFAVLAFNMGEHFLAEQYYIKAKKIRAETIGKNHPDYVSTINGLAVLKAETGNFEKAQPLYVEGLKILDKLNDRGEKYYTILTNLGELYEDNDSIEKAIEIYQKAYQAGVKIYGQNNFDFIKLQKKIANAYKVTNQFEKADSLYTACLKIFEDKKMTQHPDYAGLLNNRGTLYIKYNQYEKAEKDLLKSAKLTKDFYGEYNYQYSISLNNLASLYYSWDQLNECDKNLVLANEIVLNAFNNSLSYMTGQELEAYTNSIEYLFDIYYSYYHDEQERNPALTGFAYDNILAFKGMMLQTEKSLRQSIFMTKDSLLIKKYLEFISTKEELARIHISGTKKDNQRKEELESLAEKQKKELIYNSEIFQSTDKYINVGWLDVKNNLQDNETAIELVKFEHRKLYKTGDVYYCALILKKDFKYPKFIYLFKERELNKILNQKVNEEVELIEQLYHKNTRKGIGLKPKNDSLSNKLDSLIWRKIEPHLGSTKKIFLSPTGNLHKISFAALSINDSTYISDKYDLFTLMSSRNIIDHKRFAKELDYNVSLYGGIDFDLSQKEIEAQTRSYKKSEGLQKNKEITKSVQQNFNRGTTWNYLKGSLKETEIIEDLFKAQKVNVRSYRGKNAIEETFKQYKGVIFSPNIIHIATHGFFFPDPTKQEEDSNNRKNKFQQSDNPLFRSGLLFAGANRTWNNLEMPENAEDGILTAYEVSNTNLINTELVVLSACQTGLGDIKGSEGVYGLQRSFKIAGAEYVIMSLWQIPDEQTVELMQYFYTYKNLNLTIPEAFNRAQDEMKKKYLPYYWAGFVLIK